MARLTRFTKSSPFTYDGVILLLKKSDDVHKGNKNVLNK